MSQRCAYRAFVDTYIYQLYMRQHNTNTREPTILLERVRPTPPSLTIMHLADTIDHRCSRKDSTETPSAPQTPGLTTHTFSFENLNLAAVDTPRDIVPLRSPTSPNMQPNRLSVASSSNESFDMMSSQATIKRNDSGQAYTASDFLSGFYTPQMAASRSKRSSPHRPAKSVSEAPSLSNTPSSYDTTASSVPATPIERRSMAATDFSYLNWPQRPSLPPRNHPFSSSYGRTGDISLVTPFSMRSAQADQYDTPKQGRLTNPPSPQTPALEMKTDDLSFTKLSTDEAGLCSSATPRTGALNRLFNFDEMRRPPTQTEHIGSPTQ